MLEQALIVVYMSIAVAPGIGEARAFLRLKSGEYCEFFSVPCTVRGELDYGRERMEELRKRILDDYRRAHEMKTID